LTTVFRSLDDDLDLELWVTDFDFLAIVLGEGVERPLEFLVLVGVWSVVALVLAVLLPRLSCTLPLFFTPLTNTVLLLPAF
jgi:hypothetical protein